MEHTKNRLRDPASGKKKLHLELLRILAAYLVIFNHTGARGFFLFAQRAMDSASFWVYMIPSVVCRAAVPVFFCISGALMLARDQEPLWVIWKKRIGKILFTIAAFGLFNCLWDSVAQGEAFNIKQLLVALYTGYLNGETWWYGHLWYLYTYLAFLMCLPFLRSMVSRTENVHFLYLIGLALVFDNILPAAEYLLTADRYHLYSEAVPSWILAQCFLYPCVGYFLEHRVDAGMRKKMLSWCFTASVLGTVLTCWLIRCEGIRTGTLDESSSQRFFDYFVLVNCVTIYLAVKEVCHRISMKRLEPVILSAGKCTFGIYLIHIMVLQSRPATSLLVAMTSHGVNNMAAVLLQCLAVFVVSWGIVRILLLIPGVRKLVGG